MLVLYLVILDLKRHLRSRWASWSPAHTHTHLGLSSWTSESPPPPHRRRDRPLAAWRRGSCPQATAGWVWKIKNEQKQAPWSFTPILMRKSVISPAVRKGERTQKSEVPTMSPWADPSWEWNGISRSSQKGRYVATSCLPQNRILLILFRN